MTEARPLDLEPANSVIARLREHLDRGAPWDACDAFREAIPTSADDTDLLYWGALAFARVGSTQRALELLDEAQASTAARSVPLDEILSLRGRIWKDRFQHAATPVERADFAGKAREQYLAGYALRRENTYPGINAASLSLIVGDAPTAQALAREILAVVASRTNQPQTWDDATAAEAHLVLGDIAQARTLYARACDSARNDAGNVATMRRQVQLLARVRPEALEVLAVLPASTVLAFVGHLIDAPGRSELRFPTELESNVAAALRDQLAAMHRPVVYTSAACGADLLFVEAALAVGAEVNIVLPFDRQDFVRTSVEIGGAGWLERFEGALQRCHRVFMATEESYLDDDVLFDHAAQLIEGLAVLRASQLETHPSMLCVLDTQAEGGPGGARHSFERWRQHHGTPIVIDLEAIRVAAAFPSCPSAIEPTVAHQSGRPALPELQPDGLGARPHRTLKALLFADFAGFGRLHDAFAPLFHSRFLEVIAAQISASPIKPLEVNTWGDALYVVFAEAADAADFALNLLARMLQVDWTSAGLSESSQIRIALHAGPVFCGFDPIIGRDNYFGSSVTKAARIEPITPPGMVYVSEAFAATLVAAAQTKFSFEYAGRLALAKGYGESRIYRLGRQ